MNKKQKIIALRGLPASGKTTLAKSLEADGFVRIEKDDIRENGDLFPNGYNHKKGHEKIVIRERDRLIREALSDGKSVVSSDTNLNPVHIDALTEIAAEFGIKLKVDSSLIDVPLEECIARDLKRTDKHVGERVIRDMYHKYLKPRTKINDVIKKNWESQLPRAVWVDIDGTLTMGPKDRSPYDWSRVGNDDPNLAVMKILDGISYMNYTQRESLFGENDPLYNTRIMIFSGRDSSCRAETEAWLERWGVEYDDLFMRPEGDNRSDVDIKRELYEQHVKGKYSITFAIDDRPRVVNMLRDELNLMVLAIGDQSYDF